MSIRADGRTTGTARPSENYRIELERPNLSIAVNYKPIRLCDSCLQAAPRLARHVDRLEGGCSDACRRCYLQLTAAETRAALVSRFRDLFRGLRSRVFGSGSAASAREAAA